MSFLYNLPVLGWWLLALFVFLCYAKVVFAVALVLILAIPTRRWFLPPVEHDTVPPPSSLSKAACLSSMTVCGIAAAGAAKGRFPAVRSDRVLDRTGEEL